METTAPPINETWKVDDILRDDAAFEEARRALAAEIPTLERWKGRVGESAATLAAALDALSEAGRRYARLRCYAFLKADEDTRNATYQAMRQQADLLATEFSAKTAWLRPEVLALDPAAIEAFIAESRAVAVHAHYLRDLVRRRAHVLSPAEEAIMAETGLLTRDAGTLFEMLNNADLPRPRVTLSDGQEVEVTPVNFHRHRTTKRREDRARLFAAFFDGYAKFRDTLGQNLFAGVKAHRFRTSVRGYESCLHAALDPENVPIGVYHNLVRQVRENLPLLHRYFGIRRRALGVERLEYHDLHCPLGAAAPRRFATDDAQRLVTASLAPLGDTYVADLTDAFRARWIDWHPAPGKRSGAYATGWAYDAHPYVLLNFTGDADSVSTLAHEMGHAMHSFYSNRTQPFATSDYSIFVAEVASTLNEALLADRMLAEARTDDERIVLLADQIDGLRGTLFRQTMFAEFELAIHARVDAGQVLTGEILNAIYLDLLRAHHGHDAGVLHVDERYAIEWAAIPHFFYDFYVYQYSTGIVAAHALAAALLAGDADARERYLAFLASGGSDYPLELLRRAGVDLESAAPYDAAMQGLARRLDELDALIG